MNRTPDDDEHTLAWQQAAAAQGDAAIADTYAEALGQLALDHPNPWLVFLPPIRARPGGTRFDNYRAAPVPYDLVSLSPSSAAKGGGGGGEKPGLR